MSMEQNFFPDFMYKKSPLFELSAVLVQPTILVPPDDSVGNQFFFRLTVQQLRSIIGPSGFIDVEQMHLSYDAHQVQVLFCCMGSSGVMENIYPPGLVLKVNKKICPLPNSVKKKEGEPEKKMKGMDPCMPITITPYINLSSNTNTLSVMWDFDINSCYYITVYLVRPYLPVELLTRLRNRGVRRPEYTIGHIKDKLSEEEGSEIAALSLRVSLNCPLALKRIVTPCRAKTCEHLQCFDGVSFLEMMEKRPKWLCPVCDKIITYEDLIIDGYFLDVLSSPQLPASSTEIFLHNDGSWTTSRVKTEGCSFIPWVKSEKKKQSSSKHSMSTRRSSKCSAEADSSSSSPDGVDIEPLESQTQSPSIINSQVPVTQDIVEIDSPDPKDVVKREPRVSEDIVQDLAEEIVQPMLENILQPVYEAVVNSVSGENVQPSTSALSGTPSTLADIQLDNDNLVTSCSADDPSEQTCKPDSSSPSKSVPVKSHNDGIELIDLISDDDDDDDGSSVPVKKKMKKKEESVTLDRFTSFSSLSLAYPEISVTRYSSKDLYNKKRKKGAAAVTSSPSKDVVLIDLTDD